MEIRDGVKWVQINISRKRLKNIMCVMSVADRTEADVQRQPEGSSQIQLEQRPGVGKCKLVCKVMNSG